MKEENLSFTTGKFYFIHVHKIAYYLICNINLYINLNYPVICHLVPIKLSKGELFKV